MCYLFSVQGSLVTNFKPRFLLVFLAVFLATSIFSKSNPDKSEFQTGYRAGVSLNRGPSATFLANAAALKGAVAALSVPRTKMGQVGYAVPAVTPQAPASSTYDIIRRGSAGLLTRQQSSVIVPSYNSVITLSPANSALDNLSTAVKTVGTEGKRYISDLGYGELLLVANNDPRIAAQGEIFQTKYLCAGPDLEWSKGAIGMAAFAAHRDASAYAPFKYWLIKGPHQDGSRYNFPTDSLIQFGPDKKLRLENVLRKGNLTITDVKSPYSKIFEGTDSPIKDKYSVVNLSGVGTGIGSNKDDWYFLTNGGGTLDTSITVTGVSHVLKGSYLMLKSNIAGNYRALAMPVYHKDTEPDFGLGLTLVNDVTWAGAGGEATWNMDLGADEVMSVGGEIINGGLWGQLTTTLKVYAWGRNQRAYCKPGEKLGIDTRQGKWIRNYLEAPAGWGLGSEPFSAGSGGARSTFFQWPGDGEGGVGRVNIDPYLSSMFPAAFNGVDLGLSLWNGKVQYRFKAQRQKGGACAGSPDYGRFYFKPIGGINYPEELPWRMPKIKGTGDGMFDATSNVNRVFEVSARGGDAAFMPGGQTAYGTTLWRLNDIFPYQLVLRCAGRGDADAVSKLKDFFGETVPAYSLFDYTKLKSELVDGIRYGATAKLRHKESGKYLCVSSAAMPGLTTTYYLTCTGDSASAARWMVAPGLDLAARVGGTLVKDGEPIRLVDRMTDKTLCAFDTTPPVSANYGISTLDDLNSGNALLKQYDIPAGAYAGTAPEVKAPFPPTNWIAYAQTVQTGATAVDVSQGFIFANQAYGGYLSSVNGYVFKAPGSESDWIQEVTVFDSGSNQTHKDVGDFGVWMLEDYVPAPSTIEEMAAANFGEPLTLIDGKEAALISVASGSNGCIYGVDGKNNAVKVDLIKRTQEQLATDVRQVSVGADDSIIMLKTDGSIILRPVTGADQSIPGCKGRSVGIGNALTLTAVSADGGVRGHLMSNQGQQLLASSQDAFASDITDDGYIFGIDEKTITSGAGETAATIKKSELIIGQKGNTAAWVRADLSGLSEKIVDLSIGSARFMVLRGEDGGIFKLKDEVGELLFSDPSLLLSATNHPLQSSAWEQIIIDASTPLKVADVAVSSDGVMTALAGQVTENFEFKVFVKSLATWPNENTLFNLKMETTPGTAKTDSTPARPAVYSEVLVADNDRGHLEMFTLREGQEVATQARGAVAQFCMVASDGYVTLQTKSGQAMKAANAVLGLKKDDKLQNKNLMMGKNNDGTIITKGVPLDDMLIDSQVAVGFAGEKFKMYGDKDAIMEKFMFYPVLPQPDDGSGRIRFKLQNKATGGFLKYDPAKNAVVSISADSSKKALPIPRAQATTFVAFPLAAVNLKLQQALVGKNPRDAMTAFEAAWIDESTFGDEPTIFFEQLLHWLEGVRITPTLWLDFAQTTGEWTDPVTKLKRTVTASDRLQYLLSDANLLANATLRGLFEDSSNKGKVRSVLSKVADAQEYIVSPTDTQLDKLVKEIRNLSNPNAMPSNLGLLKNVHDGSVVALRSLFGIDAAGKLTLKRSSMVSDLYVAVDQTTGIIKLVNTTSIDPNVQYAMKVVPSPLAGDRNVDEGHDAADIQRWMFQASAAADATVKRLYVPEISSEVVMDSKDVALDKFVLQWGALKDTSPATLLPAYFDVQATKDKQSIVSLQSSSCSGFWAVGKPDANNASVIKEGLVVDDAFDLKIRVQDTVLNNGQFVATPNPAGDAALFEIVIITPVLQQLSGAFKKATFDERVAEFLVVSARLEKASDVITFCDAITSFLKNATRLKQDDWNAFAANRGARDKLTQCIATIKKVFSDDYGKADSLIKSSVDDLEKTIDINRVPTFGNTKTRKEIILDLTYTLTGFEKPGALDAFVTSGGPTTFTRKLQLAVNDWFASVGISVVDQQAQEDGNKLEGIIKDYKVALGMSLVKADSDALESMIATLTNASTVTQINPVDILQNIVTLNTANGMVTFGSDAKCSFLTKLWELYKASTIEPEQAISPLDTDGKIATRGVVFGLSPLQINQLTDLLKLVSKAPAGATSVGGPFFADESKKTIREDDWNWKNQPFGELSNTQIVNQLAALFVAPTLLDFVTTYLQYFALQQDKLTELATSVDEKDQAQPIRFAARLLGLAEQWNAWKKGATPRQQRQELNQFKVLVKGIKPFVRPNKDLKARHEQLVTVIQSAIDQLS